MRNAVLLGLVIALALPANALAQISIPIDTLPSKKGRTQLIELSGELFHKARIALPPDAVAVVRIEDLAMPRGSDRVIATHRQPLNGAQSPIPFRMMLDPARILPLRRYTVIGHIEDARGKPIWLSAEPVELPLDGGFVRVELRQGMAL